MSEQKKPARAKEKLSSNAGPVHLESSGNTDTNGELVPAPQVAHPAYPIAQTESPSARAESPSAQTEPSSGSPAAHAEPPKASVESEIKAVEATFARGLTDKMSQATMPGAHESAGVVSDQRAEDEKLAKVVADPYAEENQWYAACVEAGHRCLAGLPSPVKVAMVRTAAVVGVVFSFLSILACYCSSVYLSSHVGSMGLGLTNNIFINDLVGLDYVGFFVAGAACLMFWSAFFGFFKRTFRYLSIALFVGIMVHSLNFHLILSIPASVAVAVAYLPVLYLVEWIGGACREALPQHIGSKKLASALLPSLAFPALAMLLSLLYVFSPLNPPGNSNYEAASAPTLAINAMAVLLCTFIPGFVLARATKSKSPVGSASLSMLLQTPVLVGLLLTIGACLGLGMVYQTGIPSQPDFLWMQGFGGGDWAHLGGTKALSLLGGIAIAALFASGGGALGAWCNNKFGINADEKPVHSDLR